MIATFLTTISLLVVIGSPDKQAEALFAFVTKPEMKMLEWRIGMDDSGYVWLIHHWESGVYASRIAPNGKRVLDRIPLPKRSNLGMDVITDRWCNAYYIYSNKGKDEREPISLARVTTAGQVDDYHGWPPEQVYSGAYIEIIPGDTLLATGGDFSSGGYRIAKAVISPEGVFPFSESLNLQGNALRLLSSYSYVSCQISDWKKGEGFDFTIVSEGGGPTNYLRVIRMKLSEQEGYGIENDMPKYPWRDYIWRSYPDAWIEYLGCIQYKDGGYLVLIPDPADSSTTYGIRVDTNGVPVNPSDLSGGGTFSTRSFKRLPDDAKPHVNLNIWKQRNSWAPDSALVRFWGCDENGNLYYYEKVKKF